MNKRLGLTTLLLTSILFSTYGIFSRILSTQLSVYQQLSYRYFLGIFIVLVIIYFIKKQRIELKKFLRKEVLLFGLLIPFSFYMFISAFISSKLSVSISGFYAGVLISSIIIGYTLLKEKLNTRSTVAMVLIFISFIFLNNLKIVEITSIGLVYGLLSGIAYGVASYFKKSMKDYSKEEMLLVISVSTAITMQALSFINGEPLVYDLSLVTILSLIGFIFVALTAEYLTILGFRNFDLQIGSIILSLEIFFTVIVGLLFYKEVPSIYEGIGIFIILIAVILSNLPKKETT